MCCLQNQYRNKIEDIEKRQYILLVIFKIKYFFLYLCNLSKIYITIIVKLIEHQ